jgi:hypothetical protein
MKFGYHPRRSVTALKGTNVLRDYGGYAEMVRKELFYGKVETLGDAKEAARWWWYILV